MPLAFRLQVVCVILIPVAPVAAEIEDPQTSEVVVAQHSAELSSVDFVLFRHSGVTSSDAYVLEVAVAKHIVLATAADRVSFTDEMRPTRADVLSVYRGHVAWRDALF